MPGRRSSGTAALALGALLLAGSGAAAAQPTEQFGRAWSVDSFGEEPLFRPVEMVALPGCEIWVGDSGNATVYRWSCNGQPLGRVGRRGEGPGEFNLPAPMARLRGDTVAVLDQPMGRLSLFDRRGRFIRSEPIELSPGEHGFARAFGRASGTTVVQANHYPTTEPRPQENFSFLWGILPGGNAGQALLRLPAPQSIIDRGSTASARIDAPFRRVPVVLFAPDGTLLVGNTGSRELRRYRFGPRLIPAGQMRLDVPALPVTRAERRAWADSMQAQLSGDLERSSVDAAGRVSLAQRHRRLLDGVSFPETHPFYLLATQDEEGNLWLQLPMRRRDARTRWQVRNGRTGALLRTVELTPSGRITTAVAQGGSLYTIEVDGEGVARVSRYGRIVPRR
jgi:hypothetical protein